MPLVYTIGSIFGPTLGGALSNPLHIDPTKPRGHKFLERFPYALPNIVSACLFLIGIITGFLFLHETLETRKDRRDYGLILGHKLTTSVKTQSNALSGKLQKHNSQETEPLLNGTTKLSYANVASDVETPPEVIKKPLKPQAKPSYREVLTRQSVLNLLVYALLAMYSIAYDQVLPVFMHHPQQDLDSPGVWLPLKFAGGFGIDSGQIGVLFTGYGIFSMVFQLLIFPPVARRFGVLRCLRAVFLMFPIIFFITPFTTLLPTNLSKQIGMFIVMIIKGMAGTFAFPASTILLTNSASSLRTLGTLNGIATSVSAIGRAAGPAIGGAAFTMGVKHGYVIAPFWILAAIAFLAAIPTFFLEEGAGFGDDPDPESQSLETDDDEDKSDKGDEDILDAEEEGGYGEPSELLSRTATHSSVASEAIESDDELTSGDINTYHPSQLERSASMSQHPRRRRSLRRQSSVPIGMGVGFRRLSSNLGSTGLPGSSWGG